MILAGILLNIQNSDFVKSFEINIQLGAILAVLVLYWKKLLLDKKMFMNVVVAFLPTAMIGFLLYPFIKHILLGNPWVVVWSLGIGGVLLIIIEKIHIEKQKNIRLRDYFLIGCAQSLSIVPGVSRSAATIVGARLLGMRREEAVEFSFLLAIPTMAAATGLDLIKSARFITGDQYMLLAIGFIGAFITALLVVTWFIGFVKKYSFIPFGIYRILLAIIFAIFVLR